MRKWYVAHTQPLKEIYAQSHLLQQGFDVYLPCIKKIRKHARKVDEIIAPLFPRYLFVNFDQNTDPWSKINSTRGVSYLITNNSSPTSLSDKIISDLKFQENKDGIVPLSCISVFTKGEQVRITDGSFKYHKAIFENFSDNDRVLILLNFLGREIKVLVPAYAIEAV